MSVLKILNLNSRERCKDMNDHLCHAHKVSISEKPELFSGLNGIQNHNLCRVRYRCGDQSSLNYNRIYNKILDRDWFSARLFVMVIGLSGVQFSL